MFLRMLAYFGCGALIWHRVAYVFDRNLMQGLYPEDGDSIFIPIMTNQVLLISLVLMMLPTTILGSRWVMTRLGTLSKWLLVPLMFFVASLYAVSMLISFSMSRSQMDQAHIELGVGYALFLLITSLFFIIDVRKSYKNFFRKKSTQALAAIT